MSTETAFSLANYGITVKKIFRNASPGQLYELGLQNEPGTAISSTGALMAYSGEKTGRSPKDKRIVDDARAPRTSGGATSTSS
jgi:phosphoenolpyruvate carboxykinase (ATP)